MSKSEYYSNWPKLSPSIQAPPLIPYPEERCDWGALWCRPDIDKTAWISSGAIVVGRVRLKSKSSVWYGSILRGDDAFIEVGEETNVQDGSILHIEPDSPCILGKRVTLGHRATVHASLVEDGAMIGIGATVLSHCVIGEGALVAAGALVLEGNHVPAGTLWAGVPAKQIKQLTSDQRDRLAGASQHYVNLAAMYLRRFGRDHIEALQRPMNGE
ncbi:MAG: gamma carbonic anhydrase family protein [Methanothrix sp.]|nr:gamma carbonic anhydrase family protein [Methanothrix sp.]